MFISLLYFKTPPIPQIYNMRELQKRRSELDRLLGKCYLKLGNWQYELEGFKDASSIGTIINYYENAKEHNRDSYKAWQSWAYANYEAIQFYKATPNSGVQKSVYVRPAIQGFFSCIRLSSSANNTDNNCLQDTLRLLTLWFDYCNTPDIYEVLSDGIKHTPMEIWLQVIPQLIARIDTNKQYVARLIHGLLVDFGRVHPQALVYRIILASKCSNRPTTTQQQQQQPQAQSNKNVATLILDSLREHNNLLVEQAKLVSEELIRVAILWHEMWYESLEEASKLFFGEKDTKGKIKSIKISKNKSVFIKKSVKICS